MLVTFLRVDFLFIILNLLFSIIINYDCDYTAVVALFAAVVALFAAVAAGDAGGVVIAFIGISSPLPFACFIFSVSSLSLISGAKQQTKYTNQNPQRNIFFAFYLLYQSTLSVGS